MECRTDCGACCIAPSISSLGKEAGVPCIHLDREFRCGLWSSPLRPRVCSGLQARPDTCGVDRKDALAILSELEILTRPDPV